LRENSILTLYCILHLLCIVYYTYFVLYTILTLYCILYLLCIVYYTYFVLYTTLTLYCILHLLCIVYYTYFVLYTILTLYCVLHLLCIVYYTYFVLYTTRHTEMPELKIVCLIIFLLQKHYNNITQQTRKKGTVHVTCPQDVHFIWTMLRTKSKGIWRRFIAIGINDPPFIIQNKTKRFEKEASFFQSWKMGRRVIRCLS
jgi:hypothetical protein